MDNQVNRILRLTLVLGPWLAAFPAFLAKPNTDPAKATSDAERSPPVCGVATIEIGGVSYRLASETRTYFVRQPFRLTLFIKNLSQSKRLLPPVLNAGYRIRVRGPRDSEDQDVFSVQEAKENQDLLPGASRTIDLPRRLVDYCSTPGPHELQYRYFGTHSDGGPKWATPPISIECVEQPLVIPEGTDDRVKACLRKLRDSPGFGIGSSRPGWTAVDYDEPMKQLSALGQLAVPTLLANLNNYAIEMPVTIPTSRDPNKIKRWPCPENPCKPRISKMPGLARYSRPFITPSYGYYNCDCEPVNGYFEPRDLSIRNNV